MSSLPLSHPAWWERPIALAIIVGTVAIIVAVVAGLTGYKLGSPNIRRWHCHTAPARIHHHHTEGHVMIFLGIIAACGAVPLIGMNFDRIIVFAMRRMHIFAYPNAIRIAVSLERDTHEWEFGSYTLKHPRIGTIRYYSQAAIVCVELGDLTWEPNIIERRIICDAARGAFARHINAHMEKVLPA